MLIAQILIAISVAVLAWVFVGYPLFVLTRGRFLKRSYETSEDAPSISVIVAAYNEAGSIGDRIRNLLSLDYPENQLQIVVASDGSDDDTVSIARGFESQSITVLDLPRAGKIPAVNTAIQHATGEFVVMTDANSHFEPGTLRALMRPFADSSVGGVAGNQVYAKNKPDTDAEGEQLYWNLDRRLKQALSNTWSVVSATGAVYAIRRSLVPNIPSAVTDDFYISTNVIATGHRLVFAPDAIAIEPTAEKTTGEFARKVRVITRGFRALWERRTLFNPFRTGLYAVDLLTYKFLKRLVSIPLLVIFICSGILATESKLFLAGFCLQAIGYGVAIVGWMLAGTAIGRFRPISIAAYVGMVNIAALRALWNSLVGRRIDRWEPQRGAENAMEATN